MHSLTLAAALIAVFAGAPAAAALPLISEVFYDAAGSDESDPNLLCHDVYPFRSHQLNPKPGV